MKRALVFATLLVLLGAPVSGAQSVTMKTFRAIEEVQLLMEQEQHATAQAKLEELIAQIRDIPYDYALANQYLAHTSVMLDQPAKARRALQAALATSELPPALMTDLQLFYGTFLLGEKDFDEAVSMLEQWLAAALQPQPKQVFNVGYANFMAGRLPRADELLGRVFASLPAAQRKTSWYQVYYQIKFDRKAYAAAEGLLFDLLQRDPTVEAHWRLLASHYLQLDKSNDALAAIMLAYLNDLLREPEDFERIISLYGYIESPDKAARLLEKFLSEEKIASSPVTLKQLGSLWLIARERDKAKSVLEEAAGDAPDGRTFQMLGAIHFEDEDWAEAHAAYQQALRLGGLEEPLRVSLLSGISAWRAGLDEEARTALERAATSDKYRKQANSILKRL